jgi:hypothetical protein
MRLAEIAPAAVSSLVFADKTLTLAPGSRYRARPGPFPVGAPVAELVDALDSKSSSARSAGSIPARGTKFSSKRMQDCRLWGSGETAYAACARRSGRIEGDFSNSGIALNLDRQKGERPLARRYAPPSTGISHRPSRGPAVGRVFRRSNSCRSEASSRAGPLAHTKSAPQTAISLPTRTRSI